MQMRTNSTRVTLAILASELLADRAQLIRPLTAAATGRARWW